MPRKPRRKDREKWTVNDWRGHNYMVHFEKRAYIKALPETLRQQYARACELIPLPKLNLWGVGEYNREQEQLIFAVNLKAKLDVWYLNPWYCSDSGWDDFQEQWKNLPEVVHTHCVPIYDVVHMYTEKNRKSKVVHREG